MKISPIMTPASTWPSIQRSERPSNSHSSQPAATPLIRSVGTRLALAMLACVLAFSTLVSTLTIAELHDHDCVGEGCPTCLVLEISHAVLSLAAAVPAGALAIAALMLAVAAPHTSRRLLLSAETPVSLKVRLVI